MENLAKKYLKRYKLSLLFWYSMPFSFRSMIPQRFIKRNNYELYKVLRKVIAKNKSGIIVIGANDGTSFDNLMPSLLQFLLKKCFYYNTFFIEPIQYYYNKLVENMVQYGNNNNTIKCYNFALHPSKKSENIYMVSPELIKGEKVPDWLSGSSSFSYDFLRNKHNLPKNAIHTVKVNCKNFNDLISQMELDMNKLMCKNGLYKFDYLQIDTEGFDDQILAMIDFNMYDIEIVRYEKSHFSDLQLEEVRNKMNEFYNCLDFGEDEVCFRK